MPRRGIVLADVQRAKAALTSQGVNASADNIRAYLGTGSKTTVLSLLAAEADAGPAPTVEDPPETLPTDLADALSAAAAGWYSRAREVLREQAEISRGKLKKEMDQLPEVRAEAMAAQLRADEFENDTAAVRVELVASRSEVSTLRDELRRTQQELASVLGAASSERMRADVAVSEAKEARRYASEELNLRIVLEREKAGLLEAARRVGRRSGNATGK